MQFRTRPTPCSSCGDTVLVVVHPELRLFGGLRASRSRIDRVEHADPGPDGETHDGVDDACRRPRVR